MQSNAELSQRLTDLCSLESQAVAATNNIIEECGESDPALTRFLKQIRDEHGLHVGALRRFIHELGGNPPEMRVQVDGFLIGGMFSIRSLKGREGALQAVRTNKTLTAANYESSLYWDAPERIKAVLERFCESERRHRMEISAHPAFLGTAK